MTVKIISWAEAKKENLTRYYNGVPCKWGHIDQRATSNRQCIRCRQEGDRVRKNSKEWKENLWNLLGTRLRSMRKKDRKKFNHKLETTRLDLLEIYNRTYDKKKDQHICEVLETVLTTVSGPTVISFDRIDSTKPHTKDNLVCVSWEANSIKMDHGSDKLFKVAEWTKRQEKKYGLPSNRSISDRASRKKKT